MHLLHIQFEHGPTPALPSTVQPYVSELPPPPPHHYHLIYHDHPPHLQ